MFCIDAAAQDGLQKDCFASMHASLIAGREAQPAIKDAGKLLV